MCKSMLRYGAAEADCNQALSLDGSYTKAYLRRGAARFQLGRVQEAEADYRKVLKLEPSNRQAQEELKNISKVNFSGQNINPLRSPASLCVCHAISLLHPTPPPPHPYPTPHPRIWARWWQTQRVSWKVLHVLFLATKKHKGWGMLFQKPCISQHFRWIQSLSFQQLSASRSECFSCIQLPQSPYFCKINLQAPICFVF